MILYTIHEISEHLLKELPRRLAPSFKKQHENYGPKFTELAKHIFS